MIFVSKLPLLNYDYLLGLERFIFLFSISWGNGGSYYSSVVKQMLSIVHHICAF